MERHEVLAELKLDADGIAETCRSMHAGAYCTGRVPLRKRLLRIHVRDNLYGRFQFPAVQRPINAMKSK